MDRIEFQTGLDVSRLIYGMWRLGDDPDTSTAHVIKKIESCLAQGITSFDQADIYGDYRCETILGAALRAAPGLRPQMQIITKCDINLLSSKFPERRVKHYDSSAGHITSSVDRSLANMATDYIDVLLIHRPDPLMDHHETARALDALVDAGKVRAVGVSNFKPWDWKLLQSALKTKLVTNQIEISLIENDAFSDGDIAFLQQKGISPMAWSPLAGGRLFDTSQLQYAQLHKVLAKLAGEHSVAEEAIAIAWLLKHPSRILPVMGSNNLSRIASMSTAMSVSLSREEWFILLQAARGEEVA